MEYIPAKQIIHRGNYGWFGTDYNMNLYRGCNHGCIYCDSRSSCYHIEDFQQVRTKEDALLKLRNDLRRKIKSGVVATGAMSDPYNPWERKLELTRHALELLSAYQFGVAIATKSDLVLRDISILEEIREHSPVLVKITITTINDTLAKQIEPHVALPSVRLEVLRTLSVAGIFCGVLLMPVLPWLTDSIDSMRLLVEQVAATGARFIYPGLGVTMRDGQREYFYEQLNAFSPGLSQKYRSRYGLRYHCAPPKAQDWYCAFTQCCKEHGLLYQMKDITIAYKMGYQTPQIRWDL